MKKIICIILILSLFFISGCTKYTAPNSLMSAPSLKSNSANNSNAVINYLPFNAKLLSSDEIANGKAVIEFDFDNDNNKEIAAFFKYENSDKKGFVILKKNSSNNWTNVYEKVVECNKVCELDFINVLSKNSKSLLLGFSLSDQTMSEYHTYSLINGKVIDKYMGSYNKFQILNTPDVNGKDFTFAVWNEKKEYMDFDIIRCNSKGVFYDDSFNKSYYSEILKYYNNILNDSQNNQYAWYGLIKAEINSGDSKVALENIEKAVKKYGYDNKLKLYEASANVYLKNYDKAASILNDAVKDFNDVKYSDDTLKYTQMDKDREYAYIYIEKGRLEIIKGDTESAQKSLNKANEIINTLDENNYYSMDQGMVIYKDIDINTVNEEKAKLKNN